MKNCKLLRVIERAEGMPQLKCTSQDFDLYFPNIRDVFNSLYEG